MNSNGTRPGTLAAPFGRHSSDDRGDGHAPAGATLRTLVRWRWRWIAGCTLAVTLVALAFSLLQPPRYAATASLLFRDPGIDQQLFGLRYFGPSSDPGRQAATHLRLVSLDAVARRTAARLGLTDAHVRSKIDVQPGGMSDVIDITASDRSPVRAARLANTFARQYIAFRRQADDSRYLQAIAQVRREIATLTPRERRRGRAGRALRERAAEVGAVMSLDLGNAEIANAAEPPEQPAAPSPRRSAAIGLVLGLLLGLLAAVARERSDRRLRTSSETQAAYGAPVLSAVPELGPDMTRIGVHAWRDHGVVAPHPLAPADAEPFLSLRANLKHVGETGPLRAVAVTSAAPAEGKSVVAWNLAAVAAQAGTTTLLIDGDIRRACLGGRSAGMSALGLTDVLVGDGTLDDSVVAVPVADGADSPAFAAFDLLFAGAQTPNPTDLLESEHMRALLAEAKARYELVLVDTPPATLVSEAIPLLKRVDGVAVVSHVGTTTHDAARSLRTQLDKLGVPLVGVVLNRARGRRDAGAAYYARPGRPLRTDGALTQG